MDEKIFGENEEEPEDQWVDNTRAGIAVELKILNETMNKILKNLENW